MKKTSIIFILCLLSSFLLFSQEIKVTSPVSGDSWKLGTTHAITWNYNGPASTDMKINVFKDSINQSNFVEQLLTKNDHSEPLKLDSKYKVGTYIIRIKTADNKHYGDSSKFDVIKKSGIGLIDSDFRPVIMSINVIKPSSTSNWKEGSTQKIIWKNRWTKRKKIKIDLYNYNGTKFIKNIYTRNYIGTKPVFTTQSSYSWKIPKGTATALGYHKIRISRLDQPNVKGFSSKFHISRTTAVKKYKIYSKTVNKYRYHWWKNDKNAFSGTETPKGDPGPGKTRSGYENYFHTDGPDWYYGFIYRSHVYFDVSQFKGKGLILSATLHFNKFLGGNCALRIYKINKAFTDIFKVDADFLTNLNGITSIVQKWVAFSDANHGLLFMGNNEKYSHNNSKCLTFCDNIYLEIEVLGKE